MEKKPFKDTKLGKFLKEKVPGVLDVVDDYFPPAKILTALVGKESLPPEDQSEFLKLLQDHEREMYALEVQDRDSARNREVEIAKTGKSDWMMRVVGIWVLILTTWIIYAVFYTVIINSEMSHFIAGEVVGFAASVVMLYYGASQRSGKKV